MYILCKARLNVCTYDKCAKFGKIILIQLIGEGSTYQRDISDMMVVCHYSVCSHPVLLQQLSLVF